MLATTSSTASAPITVITGPVESSPAEANHGGEDSMRRCHCHPGHKIGGAQQSARLNMRLLDIAGIVLEESPEMEQVRVIEMSVAFYPTDSTRVRPSSHQMMKHLCAYSQNTMKTLSLLSHQQTRKSPRLSAPQELSSSSQ